MGFYQDISYYYDSIFPFKQMTFSFLKTCFDKSIEHNKGDLAVLDIACGSGSYALAFAPYAGEVVGNDLDPFMIEQAKEKNTFKHMEFTSLNMLNILELDRKKESFDFIYCIGNSIVHLDNTLEMESFINGVYALLKPGGGFVIQVVNYNRILDHKVRSLPTIVNEDDGVTFVRDYKLIDGKIEFATTLDIETDCLNEQYKQKVMLYPLLSQELLSLYEKAGFTDIKTYGGFNKSDYKSDESFALVVEGYKEVE